MMSTAKTELCTRLALSFKEPPLLYQISNLCLKSLLTMLCGHIQL